jgi:hypothetical protein
MTDTPASLSVTVDGKDEATIRGEWRFVDELVHGPFEHLAQGLAGKE